MFQKLPFYNTLIEKPWIKRLKNIDLLYKLSFYNQLNIRQVSKAFKRYARSYKIEIIDLKHPLAQSESTKSSIKDLFKDLLDEIKGFKYEITVKVLLRKHKEDGDIEFTPAYFNSATKTVIDFKYTLDKSSREILYRIDNWVNEGSGWVIESINAEYVNISIYSSLSTRSCIELSIN